MARTITSLLLCDADRVPVLTAAETAALLGPFEVTERLGEPDVRVSRTPALAPDARYLRARATLRIAFDTGEVEWWEAWRVEAPEGEPVASGADVGVEWRPYWLRLADAVALPRVGAGADADDLTLAVADRFPADALAVLFDPENGAPALPDGTALFAVGTVHALYAERRVEASATVASCLAVLGAVCESLRCEWEARVVPGTAPGPGDPYADTYAVDLVVPAGEQGFFEPGIEAADVVLDVSLLPKDPDRNGYHGPGIGMLRTEDALDAVSALVPVSDRAEDGEQAGVSGALFYPAPSSFNGKIGTTEVDLFRSRIGDYPPPALVVWEDGALDGYALEEAGGLRRVFPIEGSAFPNRLTLTGDAVTDPLHREVRVLTPEDHYGTGTGRQRVRALASPTLEAAFGYAERGVRFAAHPRANLLARAGASADLSRWDDDTSLPYGLELTGDATAAETTDAQDVQYGDKAVEITFDSASAVTLTGDDLDVSANVLNEDSDNEEETATYADGGASLAGDTFRATAQATVEASYGRATTTHTATLRLVFLDGSNAVLDTVTDSLGGNGTRTLVAEGVAPSGTVTVRVETEADASATLSTPPAYANLRVTVSGAGLERDPAGASASYATLGAGCLGETGAAWFHLRVTEGEVEACVLESDGTVASNEEGELSVAVTADPEDPANTPFSTVTLAWTSVPEAAALALRPTTGRAVVVWDAATAVSSTTPAAYRSAMGPEALWELAAREVARRKSDLVSAALSTFEGEYLDLQAAGVEPGVPVRVGQAVRIRGAFTAYAGEAVGYVSELRYRDGLGQAAADRQIAAGPLGPDLAAVIEAAVQGEVTVTAAGGGLIDTGGQYVATAYAEGSGGDLSTVTLQAVGDATITQGTARTVTLGADDGGGTLTLPVAVLGSASQAAANVKRKPSGGVLRVRVLDQT